MNKLIKLDITKNTKGQDNEQSNNSEKASKKTSQKSIKKEIVSDQEDGVATGYDVAPVLGNELTKMSKVFAQAKSQLGVKEFKLGSNKTIEKYHAFSTKENKSGTTDDVPWCASFVCYCLEMAGYQSTNSKLARSYEKYGMATKIPRIGDIVVFWRGSKSSGKGHVGFFAGFDKQGSIIVLGGNQADAVCYASYSKSNLIGYRTI